MASTVEIVDHSEEFLDALEQATEAALEAIGIQAVSHTVENITRDAYKHPVDWYARTGHLKDFSHQVEMSEKAVYVGSAVPYSVYWELGTGEYADKGGRSGYWVFVPGSGGGSGSGKVYTEEEAKRVMAILQSKGIDAHMTKGIKPVHMLKNAVEKNEKEYVQIIEQHLKG